MVRRGPRPLKARPTCAVCKAPVETFTEEDGDGALAAFVLFVARCHGDVQRVRVRKVDVDKGRLNFGSAFETSKQLPAAAVRGLLPERT